MAKCLLYNDLMHHLIIAWKPCCKSVYPDVVPPTLDITVDIRTKIKDGPERRTTCLAVHVVPLGNKI